MSNTTEKPLTAIALNEIIKSNKDLYYAYPELNEIVYLTGRGWTELGGLQEFVNLRAIYAENNCMPFSFSLPWITF